MEAKLQKLKVTELKELLSKHDLPQTGKKDELVKRLIENNISPDGEDVPAESNGAAESEETVPEAATSTAAPASTEQSETKTTDESSLTPEQLAMKRRAERFGIPFNPNAASKQAKPSSSSAKPASTAATSKPAAAPKEKAGAIDKTSLGISEETLAKRAAKFGIPEKKAAPAASATTPAATKPAEPEMTPEMKEKLALEEEKKRKRAEKFGTAKPASESNGTAQEANNEPDAKKAKV